MNTLFVWIGIDVLYRIPIDHALYECTLYECTGQVRRGDMRHQSEYAGESHTKDTAAHSPYHDTC